MVSRRPRARLSAEPAEPRCTRRWASAPLDRRVRRRSVGDKSRDKQTVLGTNVANDNSGKRERDDSDERLNLEEQRLG